MSQEIKKISPDELMGKLVMAKKVMDKVETGSYEKGNINQDLLKLPTEQTISENIERTPSKKTHGAPSVEKIKQSKLPDAIKRAMIENPIPQISLNDTIDMDIVKGAKKLMEREGMISKSNQGQSKSNTAPINTSDLIETITPIIENVVRKVMDEKLTQILTAHQTASMNENLVLKVGDSIFNGKITGVKKSK
jgi:hypothetical protein